MSYRSLFFTLLISAYSLQGFSFETTKVLPKGVRNVRLKTVNTDLSQKADASGLLQPLAKPFMKEMNFKKIVNGELGVKKMLLQSFLHGKFKEEDSIGDVTADLKGHVAVAVPVVSYGVTDKLTVAGVFPYYRAKMKARLGFRKNKNFDRLVSYLTEANQLEKANDVKNKFANMLDTFNEKLQKNGYNSLSDWEDGGFGDITLAGKYQAIKDKTIGLSFAGGFVLPAGRTKDADLLVDIPFGKGSLGVFAQGAIDEYLNKDIFFNQYIKYIYQSPSKTVLRLKTEEEALEVPKAEISYKRGDEWEIGLSANFEPEYGLVAGLGLVRLGKFKDRFDVSSSSKSTLESGTDELSDFFEAKLGYSTLPAFKRKEFPAPISLALEMRKFVSGKNSASKDLYSVDMNLFF